MRIVAASDLHGYFPEIPECDLLLVAGDICRRHEVWYQENWFETNFKWWLRDVPAKKKVFIFGNHDFIGESRPELTRKIFANYPGTYLQEDYTTYEGLKIYGLPHTLYFGGFAFNLYEKDIAEKWKQIPDDTDILVVHGPPYGYGDAAPRDEGFENVGSPSLLERIKEIKPKLVVYGHVHGGYNTYKIPELPDTILANVSVVNEKYQLVNKPMIFEIEGKS